MDLEFIKNAEKLTTFNIDAKHFQSLDYKQEIRYLFGKHFFPDFDIKHTINCIEQKKVNDIYFTLKDFCNINFSNLHNYRPNGIGPGEISLYFAVDTVKLGGSNSAGVDAIDERGEYEIKAVNVSKDGWAYDFRLGGTVDIAPLTKKIDDIRIDLKLPGNSGNISGSSIKAMEVKYSKEMKQIKDEFVTVAHDYFKNHKVVFVNNKPTKKYCRLGIIESIKYVDYADIQIERISGGSIKPRIKLWHQ